MMKKAALVVWVRVVDIRNIQTERESKAVLLTAIAFADLLVPIIPNEINSSIV